MATTTIKILLVVAATSGNCWYILEEKAVDFKHGKDVIVCTTIVNRRCDSQILVLLVAFSPIFGLNLSKFTTSSIQFTFVLYY